MTTPNAQESKPEERAKFQAAPRTSPNRSLNENVTDVVREAYDVIAENIAQTRDAADRFRHGAYKFDQVPGDLDKMMKRAFELSSDLNSVAFQMMQKLIIDVARARYERTQDGADTTRGATSGAAAGPKSKDPGFIPLTVRFVDEAALDKRQLKAIPHTVALRRPVEGKGPSHIKAGPLMRQGERSRRSFGKVSFDFDLNLGVLVAKVGLADAVTEGWYSTLVYIPGEEAPPLGLLDVKVEKTPPKTKASKTPPEAPGPEKKE